MQKGKLACCVESFDVRVHFTINIEVFIRKNDVYIVVRVVGEYTISDITSSYSRGMLISMSFGSFLFFERLQKDTVDLIIAIEYNERFFLRPCDIRCARFLAKSIFFITPCNSDQQDPIKRDELFTQIVEVFRLFIIVFDATYFILEPCVVSFVRSIAVQRCLMRYDTTKDMGLFYASFEGSNLCVFAMEEKYVSH